MNVAAAVVALHGIFSITGGVIGYLKAKSKASLIAGSISGALLLLCAYGIGQGNRMALLGVLAVAFALGARFLNTWLKHRRVMPDALMVLLRVRPRISRTLRCGARWLAARSDDESVPPGVRRGGATPQMAACRRNPESAHWLGRSASPRRVVQPPPSRRRRHAGREGVRPRRLRTGDQYAALLAPCAARISAQRRAREILGRTLSRAEVRWVDWLRGDLGACYGKKRARCHLEPVSSLR